MIALLLREIAIELSLGYKRMLKYGGEVCRGHWCRDMEERVRSEDIEVDVRIGSECILYLSFRASQIYNMWAFREILCGVSESCTLISGVN